MKVSASSATLWCCLRESQLKSLLLALGTLALAIGQAHGQSISCESSEDGDAHVTTCEGEGYRSSIRCDTSGCKSSFFKTSSSNPVEISMENLRRYCKEALEDKCSEKLRNRFAEPDSCMPMVDSACGGLSIRIESFRKVYGDNCDGLVPRFAWITPTDCRKLEEMKSDDALIERYSARKKDVFTADTLKMCDKGVLDKAYCEDFKKKQEDKTKNEKKDSEPAKKEPEPAK
jgi:hypothetical protein